MEPQEQEGGGGDLGALINTIGQGLTSLAEGLAKAGAPEELVAGAGQLLEGFTQFAQALSGGGAPAPGPTGPAPMEGGTSGVPAGDPRMRG